MKTSITNSLIIAIIAVHFRLSHQCSGCGCSEKASYGGASYSSTCDLCPSGSCNQCPMAAPTMAPMPMMPVNPMMIAMMAGSMVGGAAGMVPMKVKRVAKRGSQTVKREAIKRTSRIASKSKNRVKSILLDKVGKNKEKLTSSGFYVVEPQKDEQIKNLIRSKTLDYLISVATKADLSWNVLKHIFSRKKRIQRRI